ncbi:Glucan endo-1,6-beta-glucosidase B OS=Emericella nidulans (strain FGSC A4 / ATCC 38163 / CBS 112,46 / NRRL 194 / M139) GN=exgB PE=2 SV=1 [Rhizoctonia solani AG-1 IB]|uniref:Glucan endo-1,6-beta-glucosidase B n=1 Tax=Thanatephorus cucumeris (strain AG1-IB / isolate 7/3/14) TaxID=1108050 RepID=A0A0B7FQC5_THACB|nr:Glucan endo-1,6-beta-glucosidase B OS=Emericella nidulans (strain FGSC A4 / ATCC 38163 / CBS 112,46 / NRRL 194 / M139) GN=exgB PE=2 SV=1 [Rhizoctonia solani AG-1 IB]
MRLQSVALGTGLLGATVVSAAKNGLPVDKIYGVNLGSWLLVEPWMLPNEWVNKMEGERCDADCSSCAASEFGLVKKLGQERADQVFEEHWATWFTEKDVDEIVAAGLNSVRIPLGYWLVESLVDRTTEFYPRGGIKYLKKGLGWLKKKGIHVKLDHHALPGVSTANQMFAGQCTGDVQFYTEKNYKRALIWAGVMTAISHLDPDFSTVFAIEAINEPTMDANQTPGYGDYQKRFVKVVRMVEYALGIKCADTDYTKLFTNSSYTESLDLGFLKVATHVTDPVVIDVLKEVAISVKSICAELNLNLSANMRRSLGVNLGVALSTTDVVQIKEGHGAGRGAMSASGPVVIKRSEPAEHLDSRVPHGSSFERHSSRRRLHHERGISATLSKGVGRSCLMTSFQNRDWQYNNPPNPADAAIGPQLYDAHLYFAYGGVADANAESYMQVICNTDRVRVAAEANNSPLVFGEWSLATNFGGSPEFLRDWADAQKSIYAGQADGWYFWSFKIEEGSPNLPNWSYFESLKAGYFTKDPSKLFNPDICKPWVANSTSTTV